MTPLRRTLLLLWLALAAALGAALMLAAGIWSSGLYLAPIGLLAGLLVGPPQRRLLEGSGHPAPSWTRGAVLAWGAFGLAGAGLAWLLQRLGSPPGDVFGFVAWASPAVVGGALVAGVLQSAFVTKARAELLATVTFALALPALAVVTAVRLEVPWPGVALAAVLHAVVFAYGGTKAWPPGRMEKA